MPDPTEIAEQRRIQESAGLQWREHDARRDARRAERREDQRGWQMRATGAARPAEAPAQEPTYVVGVDLIQHMPDTSARQVEEVRRSGANYQPQAADRTSPQTPTSSPNEVPAHLRNSPEMFL